MKKEDILKEIAGCCINDQAAEEATNRILRLFGVGSSVACPKCKGEGWYSDHANHPHPDGDCCGECPVQVECGDCCATGKIKPENIEIPIKVDIDDLPF